MSDVHAQEAWTQWVVRYARDPEIFLKHHNESRQRAAEFLSVERIVPWSPLACNVVQHHDIPRPAELSLVYHDLGRMQKHGVYCRDAIGLEVRHCFDSGDKMSAFLYVGTGIAFGLYKPHGQDSPLYLMKTR